MTAAAEDVNEPMADMRATLSDLTKIPQKEFEKQFRSWMERDGVARALQAKLRCDLVTNFNRTTLGKRILAQTSTNRLTLSPMILALNTLVAEFLFSQNCHFSLSVFCTEVPFRNTLPDFENMRHFRFKESEITEIFTALSGASKLDWQANRKVARNYAANNSTSLLFFIMKALLEQSEESAQQKVTIGTNTWPLPETEEPQHNTGCNNSLQQAQPDAKSDLYNTNFRYLNKYLIILSKKVKEMSDRFENLQKQHICNGPQPRVRVMKSCRRRKYDDLNRSLERVTENLKQMANAKRKNKQVGTIVKAIETLAVHFEKCAANFENVSKDLRVSGRPSRVQVIKMEKSTSAESLKATTARIATATSAASQTEMTEKSYRDWVHEMRYTHNGQRFLDRVEKSLRKAMEKQKTDLKNEVEVKLRHQRELLRIRYKQKLIEHLYVPGTDNPAEKRELNASISEQFRQFEIKHFDLLNKIYESEAESKPAPSRIIEEAVTEVDLPVNARIAAGGTTGPTDLIATSSGELLERSEFNRNVQTSQSAIDIHNQVRAAVEEIVEEERNVDQIVYDAKLRIKELEQESNQLTENFLSYLERQREQKIAAREAAHNLWKDYMSERDKMRDRYILTDVDVQSMSPTTNHQGHHQAVKAIQNCGAIPKGDTQLRNVDDSRPNCSEFGIDFSVSSSSGGSSSYMRFTNPITQAKHEFFERERKFKAEAERVLNQAQEYHFGRQQTQEEIGGFRNGINHSHAPELNDGGDDETTLLSLHQRQRGGAPLLVNNLMTQLLCDSMSGTDLSTLWMANNQINATNASATAPTTVKTTETNVVGSLEYQRLQSGGVNNSKRRETIATATESGANRKTKTKPTTKPNKNNNCERENGVSVPEAHSNNYKVESGYGHKNAQQTEWNQNGTSNSTSNNNNNNNHACKPKGLPSTPMTVVATTSSQKSSKRSESNRKAVLEQSMARMQQLFLQNQHQQSLLDDVTEEEEEYETSKSGTASEREEHYKSNKGHREKHKSSIKTTNARGQQVVVNSGGRSENAVSHYKNNLQLKQITTKSTTTGMATMTTTMAMSAAATVATPTSIAGTATMLRKSTTSKEQSSSNDAVMRRVRRSDVTPQSKGDMSKQNAATRMPSNNGNKATEAVPDWQQIACGPSDQNSRDVMSFKMREIPKGAEKQEEQEEGEAMIFARMVEDSNAVEPGEVIEMEKEASSNEVPEAQRQLEIGELIESGAMATTLPGFTNFLASDSSSPHSTALSSIDLQLSVGGGRSAGNSVKNRKRDDFGSDSGSDFWG